MAGSTWRSVTSWLGRRPTVLPLLILTGGLVALAAGPAPPEGSWTGLPDGDMVQNVLMILILIGAAIGLIMLLLARGGPKQERKPEKRSWLPSLVALVIVFLFSLSNFEGELLEEEEAPPPPPPVAEGEATEVEPGEGFQAGDGTALLLVAAAALAVLYWSRRGLGPGDDEEAEDSADGAALRSAVARAHDHLLDGGDPRSGVLLAYRDLERALEALDLARRPSETPTEHLARALEALSIDDPAQAEPLLDLAGLYARARFSHHTISAEERDRAAEALGRARRGLVGRS